MRGKNNFTKQDIKTSARYKLWVKYFPEFVSSSFPEIKVYYSFERAGDPEYGYKKLLSFLYSRMDKIRIAIIYDNHSKEEINRFTNE